VNVDIYQNMITNTLQRLDRLSGLSKTKDLVAMDDTFTDTSEDVKSSLPHIPFNHHIQKRSTTTVLLE